MVQAESVVLVLARVHAGFPVVPVEERGRDDQHGAHEEQTVGERNQFYFSITKFRGTTIY